MATFDKEIFEEACPEWCEKILPTFTEDEFQRWLRLRDKAIPSTPEQWFFLANDLLGRYFQHDIHSDLFAQFPQLDVKSGKHFFQLSEEIKRVLILWSRGTFKTTAVEVFIVACLLYDPDLVIMVVSGNEKLAKRIIKSVKAYFEFPTKKFAALFPEYCGKNMGNQSEFTVPCRRDKHTGSPSVAISSSRSAKAGLHPDLLLVDDIVNETNFRSPALLEKCWEEYCFLEPLVNPGGYIVVTGTRYSFGDTYELIQDASKKEELVLGRSTWRRSIRTCWKDDDPAKGPFFTEREIIDKGKPLRIGNSLEFLATKKIAIGSELFACQYENHPIPGGTQSFTPALLDKQTFHWLVQPDPTFVGPYLPHQGLTFAVGDLAFIGSEKRDTTVFYICRVWNGQIWVFDCVAGKWGTEELVKQVWNNVIYKHRPQIVFIEKIPAHEPYDYAFKAYANQNGIQFYPIQWTAMDMTNDAKLIRIGACQSPLSQGRLWLYGGMPDYALLREQLERHPKSGRHDDHADCLGLVVYAPTGWHGEAVMPGSHLPEMLRKARQDDPTSVEPPKCGTGIVC